MPTITITLDAAQTLRVQTAWQHRTGQSPSVADVRLWLVNELRDMVYAEEKRIAQAALASANTFDPT